MERSRPKDRETWHSQSCSHVQGLPKTTLSSHPLHLPLLGLYPSLHQHLHLSLCLLSGESPSSHTPPPCCCSTDCLKSIKSFSLLLCPGLQALSLQDTLRCSTSHIPPALDIKQTDISPLKLISYCQQSA